MALLKESIKERDAALLELRMENADLTLKAEQVWIILFHNRPYPPSLSIIIKECYEKTTRVDGLEIKTSRGHMYLSHEPVGQYDEYKRPSDVFFYFKTTHEREFCFDLDDK